MDIPHGPMHVMIEVPSNAGTQHSYIFDEQEDLPNFDGTPLVRLAIMAAMLEQALRKVEKAIRVKRQADFSKIVDEG